MGWLRPRLKLGASLALVALALNLAFAFGHHHFEEIAHGLAAEHQSVTAHSDGDGDHHPSTATHPCFACLVVTAAAIAADPPTLPPRTSVRSVSATTALLELRDSRRTSFEARAPPQF